MIPLRPIVLIVAATALSACSTISRVTDAINPLNHQNDRAARNAVPQEGRVSILAFEQSLTPDPALQSHPIVVPAPQVLSDWSQPGGTADNSPPPSTGSAVLENAWHANLGAGTSNRAAIAAPPVIANGRLYFIDADHRVHALDATNGRALWNQELRPHDSHDSVARGGGVATSGSRVFVTTGFGFVVALNADNGHELWRAQLGAPLQSSPTVSGDRVYVITNDSELVALNIETGEVIWDYQAISEPARILSAPSVAVDGETVIAPFASGEVVALITANGRRLWSDSLSRAGSLTSLSAINDIAGRPVIDNDVAFAASHSGILAAINIRTGQRMWSRAFASTQTPWVAGDVLYAVSTDGELAAFDRTTGNIYWVSQLRQYRDQHSDSGRIAWTGPIMMGGRLILANSMGQVIAVSPESGQTVAHADVNQPIFIPPVTANGNIYLVSDSAHLFVLH